MEMWRSKGDATSGKDGLFVEIVDPFFFKIGKCDPFTFPYLVALILELHSNGSVLCVGVVYDHP